MRQGIGGDRSGVRLAVAAVALVAALLGLAAAAGAAGDGAISLTLGNLKVTENGEYGPKTLSRTKLEPIGLQVESKFETLDGSHPPALEGLVFAGDKNVAIDTQGIPTCTAAKLQSRDTEEAEAACRPAIIGTGHGTAEVAFPEQRPINGQSKLLVVNGGTSGNTTTWYVHAFANIPSPTAIVSTVKITRLAHGPYGTLTNVTIPKIAGGYGSVTSFRLSFDRTVEFKGKSYHPFSARCTNGKLHVDVEAKFSDGTKANSELFRPCASKR